MIWGLAFDDQMDDELCITLVATGFSSDGSYVAPEDGKADDDFDDEGLLDLFRRKN